MKIDLECGRTYSELGDIVMLAWLAEGCRRGPARPTVLAHMPGVECMFSTALDCTGCHFQAPFRRHPADVCRHVVRKVRGAPGPGG